MRFYESFLISILNKGYIPEHIAFIMDGNRRFATEKNQKKTKGHELGFESLKRCLEWCLNLGVKEVSVFAFAIDNFKRSKEEVDFLMKLALTKLDEISREDAFL